MAAREIRFNISNNEDWHDAVVLKVSAEGDPIDLTGYTFEMELRETTDNPYTVLRLSSSNNRLQVSEPESGALLFIVPIDIMRSISPGVYVHDIRATVSGVKSIIGYGTVTVNDGVLP